MRQPIAYRKADGKTVWRVRFRLNDRQTSETFPSRQTAQAFARDVDDLGPSRAILRLEESARRDHQLSIDQVAEDFFGWKAHRVRSDRTIADYRSSYTLWIRPMFGHRPVDHVTADDVRAWVDGMVSGAITRGKPCAPKSILDRHALLHAILAYAVRVRHITVNPCVGTDLPKKRKTPPKGLRPAEWAALHAALLQINVDAADLAEFLLASGWRWSEATDLTTYDVEDDGARMWVTMGHIGRRNAAGQIVSVEDAKADASLRRIELDEDVAPMVRRRVMAAPPGGLVFTTGVSEQNGLGGNRWLYGNFRNRYWVPAVTVANLSRKPTPHWLRHTHVGWQIMSGSNLAEIKGRIGHANISTTVDVYGGMIADVQPEALSRFAAMRRSAAAAPVPQKLTRSG